ncbi:MAG: pyruvate carboxylase subunit A [Deltaproteobacteria bacterium RIFOXYA12_FULL_58_15]|nr:MAG: pyruvate carboxylase subunit A [Deltaproteobacteria bacterium RIFOXYA12_FULL_58_15]OGR08916.1 MAG: pyruvate carboxylase subunit A [Deltaproteobacteria bacterium RIFOXYB12_FULL_58_9]
MGKPSRRINKVLIANRGEIAVRVARTLREMDIVPVAVYSDVDRIAPHVRACYEAYPIGPAPAPQSYLRGDAVIEAAKKAGADAIHPGYGFLSENAAFVEAVEAAGLIFIGPSANAMRVMGSKTAARNKMKAAGVPCVPGSEGAIDNVEEVKKVADQMGYPVVLKASAGGGGKGMRLVHDVSEMDSAFRSARSEAKNAFGDDTVYIEKAIINPHHVEIQVFGGNDGKAVWLGERECSMQRRHQKVIEETPSLAINEEVRCKMGEVACRAAEAVNYVGAGTIEFLTDSDMNFYFLEMNTRLQVEHPVTELCCGVDLVEGQVRVAQGEPLPWKQEDIVRTGHAIEVRLYAEDPSKNFMPAPGHIDELILPHGPGIRVDCGVASGYDVPQHYDPMIAKMCAWAEDRDGARRRLIRALSETAVKGITTNRLFLRRLLELNEFVAGKYHTGSIAEMMAAGDAAPSDEILDAGVIAAAVNRYRRDSRSTRREPQSQSSSGTLWRSHGWRRGGRA